MPHHAPKSLASEYGTSRRRSFAWGDVTRGELRNFDGFLDKYPEIDEQLRKNPGLINDPKYVNDHPELKEFLENHPGVRQELKEHPKYFMHREKQFDRRERAAGRRRK